MTIRTWLIIVAIAAGAGTSQLLQTDTTTTSACPIGDKCRIGGNCWINGTYHTPCPDDAPPDTGGDPGPITQPPG